MRYDGTPISLKLGRQCVMYSNVPKIDLTSQKGKNIHSIWLFLFLNITNFFMKYKY